MPFDKDAYQRSYMSGYMKRLRLKRRANGLCIDCEAGSPGFARCLACRKLDNAREAQRRIARRAQ